MQRVAYYFHARTLPWHKLWLEVLLGIALLLMVVIQPASAITRFQNRSLLMQSSLPGVTTSHTISLQYITPGLIGSVEMLYCEDPIPYMPCVTPPGLDVSQAVLSEQLGEQGFTILSQSQNRIVISRVPVMINVGGPTSSYKFENVINSTDTTTPFSIRLKSFTSASAAGPQVDVGSVRGQITNSIMIETQVPPMLLFCVAGEVDDNCTGTNDVYYSDMGDLSDKTTLTAHSQMAVGTNATQGFAITAVGTPMASGSHIIEGLQQPTESQVGKNQFGINLVANDAPSVGSDPQGPWSNAVVSPDYSTPNHFKYQSGDVVAYSPHVSLMRKYTVSYIVNSSPGLHAGVYTTTLNFIASGRF